MIAGGVGRPPRLAGLLAAVLLVGCSSARGPVTPPKSPVRPAAAVPIPNTAPASVPPDIPVEVPTGAPIRVGVSVSAARVSISATSGVLVTTPGSTTALELPRATFVAGTAHGGPRFEVQVGSVANREAARELAARAERLVPPARVVWNAASATYRVRVGSFSSRDLASEAAATLAGAGLDGWVVEAEQQGSRAASVRLLETRAALTSGRIRPARAGELLTIDGDRYRGSVEVLSWGDGLNAINILPLEEYLRGVVPKELSPEQFGEIEALKAQAVAARTYAIRNRGRYRDRGYDICATPACQVYGGREAEHPLSDRAVRETAGLVAFHAGQPINAMYTSTCGGSTEDGANLFPGTPTPYLRGVACSWEASGWGVVTRRADAPLTGREQSLLEGLGVVPATTVLDGEATGEELADWTASLLGALGLQGCAVVRPEAFNRAAYFRYLVARLCWSERAERMVKPEDDRYLLPSRDRGGWKGADERRAATWLVQEGLLRPKLVDTLAPGLPVLREDVVELFAGIVDRLLPERLESARFVSLAEGALQLQSRREDAGAAPRTEQVPLAAGVRLFRRLGSDSLATRELRLTPGEELRLIRGEDGQAVHLEAIQSAAGPSTDRDSRYHRWVVARTPEDLAGSLKRYGRVGRVSEVVPTRIGVSGRVIAATVRGDSGSLDLEGLQVRWGLGLRENLFAIDRIVGRDGRVERFVFTGKGWGHGVGLCQVGAFGLAKGGATFEDILNHYYTDITIEQIAAQPH